MGGGVAGEVAALAVDFGAAGDFHPEGEAAGGEGFEDAHVEEGAEVVGVGDEGVAVAGVEEAVEDAGGLEGEVDVGVAGRAPFEGGVGGEGDGGAGVGVEFGNAVLEEGEREGSGICE